MAKYTYYGQELYHHGILGQKWGKRNGPPYPLSESQHNRVVSKSASSGKAGMSDAALNTISIATAYATIFVAQKAYQSYIKKKDKTKDEGKTFDSLEELEQAKTLKSTDYDTVVKEANPSYDMNDRSTTTNCPNCTIATELRQRGYDVEARHLTGGRDFKGLFDDAFEEDIVWEAVKPNTGLNKYGNGLTYAKDKNETVLAYRERRLEQLSSEIATKSGNNSHGAITISNPAYGIGHVFNYSVNNKGKVTFLDGQNGKSNAVDNINNMDSSTKFSFVRLDNKTLSKDSLEYVRKH